MASVAAGSAIGHAVGSVVAGGLSSLMGGSESVDQPQQQSQGYYDASSASSSGASSSSCQDQLKVYMNCLQDNDNDANSCAWALDMLKECELYRQPRI